MPSSDRSWPSTTGVVMTHALGELRAEIAAEIAHEREIRDPALVDPLEDLTGVEPRVPEPLERMLELVPLAFRDVGPGMDGHDESGRPGRKREFQFGTDVGRREPRSVASCALNCAVFT